VRRHRAYIVVGLIAVCIALVPLRSIPLQLSRGSLTSDQLQVYGDFIESFRKVKVAMLSNRTFPLDVSKLEKDAVCLHGIELERTEASKKASHPVPHDLLKNSNPIRLVDADEEAAVLKQRDHSPAKNSSADDGSLGVLALSEIVFDKSHRFAVMKYVILCGTHCNSGAIMVLEKVEGHWVGTTRRPCSFLLNEADPRG
jgi:hypothetical protein